MSNVNLLIGRIIIGIYFLVFGAVFKIFNYNLTLEYMFNHEVPYTKIALVMTIVIQAACAIAILVGKFSKFSAFSLAILTIIINYYMHDFWNMESGLEQRHELQNFVKNTGIIAGLLILSAVHPGKYKIGN